MEFHVENYGERREHLNLEESSLIRLDCIGDANLVDMLGEETVGSKQICGHCGKQGRCVTLGTIADAVDEKYRELFTQGQHTAGNVSDYSVGSLSTVGSVAIVLGRDSVGFYAMTTICTHTECNIRDDGSISDTGLWCACHNSLFDSYGAVTSGPARKPLRHYDITIDANGAITVDADTQVSSDVRIL